MTTLPITVATPTIAPRACPGGMLEQAVASVRRQTHQPAGGMSVTLDVDRAGAAATRQRALDAVRTEFVAFLDDDDVLYPHHLATLYDLADANDADYSYSWFDGNSPFAGHRGRQMDPANPHHTTMTVLVRTELAKAVGFKPHPQANPDWPGEDWRFLLGCIEAGAVFAGTGEITWTYRVHGANTSGLPSRW